MGRITLENHLIQHHGIFVKSYRKKIYEYNIEKKSPTQPWRKQSWRNSPNHS